MKSPRIILIVERQRAVAPSMSTDVVCRLRMMRMPQPLSLPPCSNSCGRRRCDQTHVHVVYKLRKLHYARSLLMATDRVSVITFVHDLGVPKSTLSAPCTAYNMLRTSVPAPMLSTAHARSRLDIRSTSVLNVKASARVELRPLRSLNSLEHALCPEIGSKPSSSSADPAWYMCANFYDAIKATWSRIRCVVLVYPHALATPTERPVYLFCARLSSRCNSLARRRCWYLACSALSAPRSIAWFAETGLPWLRGNH